MEVNSNKEEDLYYLLNKYNIDKNKYVSPLYINNYNPDDVIENNNLYDLICPCCLYILKDPISCSSNNNSHNFCKECIDKYLLEKQNCPICKNKFEYIKNENIEKTLSNIYFKCFYQKEGCDKIIKYLDYLDHINKCKFIKYICQVDKFNNLNKDFEKCSFIGNNTEIDKHFKLCAFYRNRCKLCNENIFHLNLKNHVENKCKIRIIKYLNGDKYEGEFKNGNREGYGLYYYSDGNKYEGEFKNGNKEGYGIYYFSNGDRYEGEFKNDSFNGNGIIISLHGDKFKGEYKNGKKEGYGIYYFSNGSKYEGEFKNGQIEGHGIIIFSNGNKYEGEFKNNTREGFGKFYYSNGDKYEGEFKNALFEGYGILICSNGIKYEG